MNALAGLMNPAQIGQQVQNAFQQGHEQRRQGELRNSFSAYAQDPSAENAAAVARHDPRLGMQLTQHEQQRAQQAAETERENETRQLTSAAGQGDSAALLELWGVDPETAMRLDDRQVEAATRGFEFIAQGALWIDSLPEDQRAAAWDDTIAQGVQQGYDQLAQYSGQYSEQALQGVVARAGQTQQLITRRDPRYTAIPQGGTLVNTRSPQAVQEFQDGSQQGGDAFTAGQWQVNQDAHTPEQFAQWVEQNRPALTNSQGVSVQTDVLNGQVAYLVNGVWYDNPEGQ
tara:strand:+ start:1753 stop:2613 length:861 start_codon:yes stop_codon:yes gene_type:complete